MARKWLSAHRHFRALTKRVIPDTEPVLDKGMALDDMWEICTVTAAGRIAALFQSSRPRTRVDAGLEVLERDHAVIDVVLVPLPGAPTA